MWILIRQYVCHYIVHARLPNVDTYDKIYSSIPPILSFSFLVITHIDSSTNFKISFLLYISFIKKKNYCNTRIRLEQHWNVLTGGLTTGCADIWMKSIAMHPVLRLNNRVPSIVKVKGKLYTQLYVFFVITYKHTLIPCPYKCKFPYLFIH